MRIRERHGEAMLRDTIKATESRREIGKITQAEIEGKMMKVKQSS